MMVRALLPIELKNGNVGRGKQWGQSLAVRRKIEDSLRLAGFERQPFDRPVDIEIVRILGPGQRFWDFDSIGRGNAKELLDALVRVGWFHDDGPKWITGVQYDQDQDRRDQGPATEIIVRMSE